MTTTTAPFTYGPGAESIASMLKVNGFETTIEVNTEATNGYAVTFADRAEAYSCSRLVANSFEADPEAGSPTIAVQKCARGFQVIVFIEGRS